MRLRARCVTMKESQSLEGPASGDLEVKISTVSPVTSFEFSADSLPLIFAPTQRCPTSVWME